MKTLLFSYKMALYLEIFIHCVNALLLGQQARWSPCSCLLGWSIGTVRVHCTPYSSCPYFVSASLRRRVVCVILESGMKKRAWKTGLLNEMMLITLVLTDLNLSSIWSNVPPTYSELEKKCLLSILKNYYYAHCALWFIMGDGGTRLGKDAHWVILPFA